MLQKIKRLGGFYNDVRSELRKVTWPGKKEVYSTTTVVIVTVFFFGVYLFLVDAVLQRAVLSIQRLFQ